MCLSKRLVFINSVKFLTKLYCTERYSLPFIWAATCVLNREKNIQSNRKSNGFFCSQNIQGSTHPSYVAKLRIKLVNLLKLRCNAHFWSLSVFKVCSTVRTCYNKGRIIHLGKNILVDSCCFWIFFVIKQVLNSNNVIRGFQMYVSSKNLLKFLPKLLKNNCVSL